MRQFGNLLALFALVFLSLLFATRSYSEPWKKADPIESGISQESLYALQVYMQQQNPTGFMIIKDGRIIFTHGDITRKINVASVRKSLLNALYGIAVKKGQISLDATLESLKIDDNKPSLTELEKQATVRNLLMARSGIYHPAAYETRKMRESKPQRGSHQPGSFWHYNNWDFNALGTIYRQQTGEDIYQAFDALIAQPIGMEDYRATDSTYSTEPQSIHAAYPFLLSTRDAARFGQLYLNQGRWSNKQIVPAEWIKQSTTWYSDTYRADVGYGYLWWVLDEEIFGKGAALASGYNGQLIAVIPSRQMVVVQLVDNKLKPKGIRTKDFMELLVKTIE